MTAFNFNQQVIISDQVLLRAVDREVVLLNLEDKGFYSLNEMGAHMLHVLAASASIQQAYETLLDEFEVEPAELEADVRELVEQLARQGLVQLKPL